MKNYIALDVGGTSITASIVSPDGAFLVPVHHYPAHSGESRETIINNLVNIINGLIDEANTGNITVGGAGLGFPGPFDYENGISLMKGMQKYDSIYGVNIAAEIRQRLKTGLELRFQNDVDLYTLGECTFGVGRRYNRCLCISIGTGINSGFFADGHLVKSGSDVPENGWIYNTPYRNGLITDYVSASGIRRMMKQSPSIAGIKDVKELAQAAYGGSREALRIFNEFGEMLRETIEPFAVKFNTEVVILGGDVSRSHDLFDSQLAESLMLKNIRVIPSVRFSDNSLLACALVF